MPDDLKNRGPRDRSRINIHEPWEVTYWCSHFGCSQLQLINAVNQVGTSAEAVRKFLKK